MLRQWPAYGMMCAGCDKTRHFKKVCCSRRDQVVNELELEVSQGYNEGKLEKVSIDSIHLNKIWSFLMVELEMQAGATNIIILYKIVTRSEGNIMPLFILKIA